MAYRSDRSYMTRRDSRTTGEDETSCGSDADYESEFTERFRDVLNIRPVSRRKRGWLVKKVKKEKFKYKLRRWFRRSPKNVAKQVKPGHTIESRSKGTSEKTQIESRRGLDNTPKEESKPDNVSSFGTAVFFYHITVLTGKKRAAGTNAKVFISFHGKKKSEIERILIPSGKCSRNASYQFSVELPFDVYYVELGHDNSGLHPDWFCDQVEVNCENTGLDKIFRCKQWLSKTIGDGLIKRKLYTNHDINNKRLQELLEQYGRSSYEVDEACNRIKLQLMACSVSIKEVWPTYTITEPDKIVFVVFVENGSSKYVHLPKSLTSFDIVYREVDEARQEENEIIKKENTIFPDEQKNSEDELVDVLKKSSNKLMQSHSNLTMISASPVKSRYFAYGPDKHEVKRKPCIVFYVYLKGFIPIREPPLPHTLGPFKTDIREDEFKFLHGDEKYLKTLKIGCSIGENITNPTLGGTGGTLGAFVDLPDRRVGCITSAHALLSVDNLIRLRETDTRNDNKSVDPTIYQPAPAITIIHNNTPFGYVASAVYKKGGDRSTGVEVCVINITDQSRIPENGKFPVVAEGFTEESQPDYNSGNIYTDLPDDIRQYSFYKYGATTGYTRGAFRLKGCAVKTSSMDLHPSCELHNQIEICSVDTKPFAGPGDSGALVLLAPNNDQKDLRAIGILTGGTTSCTVFYVTPIWEVLNALNLPLRLKCFGVPTPMILDDGIETEDVQIRELVTIKSNFEEMKTNFNEKIDTINTDIDTKIGQINDNIGNEVAKIKTEIAMVKQKVENEVRKVDTKLGNVEGKVDKISSEINENFAKMFSLINPNITNSSK